MSNSLLGITDFLGWLLSFSLLFPISSFFSSCWCRFFFPICSRSCTIQLWGVVLFPLLLITSPSIYWNCSVVVRMASLWMILALPSPSFLVTAFFWVVFAPRLSAYWMDHMLPTMIVHCSQLKHRLLLSCLRTALVSILNGHMLPTMIAHTLNWSTKWLDSNSRWKVNT